MPGLCGLATLAGLLWLAAALLYHETRPVYGPATLLMPGASPRSFAYPFYLHDAPRMRFVLQQELDLPRVHPTTFVFYPLDFLRAISVNGHDVPAAGLPLSGASEEGRSINLAPFLHPGVNQLALQMEARWGEASFNLAVSPWDRCYLMLLVFVLGATGATAALLYIGLRASTPLPEMVLLLSGIALRIIYFFGTPYFVRSFDFSGHTDYLDYVARHLSLPPANAGWESFQPPLYYIVAGGITKLLLLLGMAESQRFVLWQGISLLLSVGVLAAGWAIAMLLYEKRDSRRLYLLAILAVAPPLVFNAARVSNDGLLALLACVWLALLLFYWRRPGKTILVWLAVVLGLALLTKANAIAFVIVTSICLLLDRRFTARSRIISLGVTLAICTAISGGYYLPRAFHANEVGVYVVGNLHSLSAHVGIDHVFTKSLIFNPAKVVRYPFDESLGPRRDYFLEVFFKTMLMGEWIKAAPYKFLARWMLIVALLLVPFLALGLVRRADRDVPLVITLAVVFLSQWLFLQCAPYLSTQDMRYSVVLLAPVSCLVLQGIYTSGPRLKSIATFLLQVALLNSAIYITVLALAD